MHAMTMPATDRNGTGSTNWMVAMIDCWMTLESLRVRVIIEPVPKRSKSPPENESEAS